MPSFVCNECQTSCIDTFKGYVTGCDHHPANSAAVDFYDKALKSGKPITEDDADAIRTIMDSRKEEFIHRAYQVLSEALFPEPDPLFAEQAEALLAFYAENRLSDDWESRIDLEE